MKKFVYFLFRLCTGSLAGREGKSLRSYTMSSSFLKLRQFAHFLCHCDTFKQKGNVSWCKLSHVSWSRSLYFEGFPKLFVHFMVDNHPGWNRIYQLVNFDKNPDTSCGKYVHLIIINHVLCYAYILSFNCTTDNNDTSSGPRPSFETD